MIGSLGKRIEHRLKRRLHAPDVAVEPAGGLMRLGSRYGGWTFRPSADLEGATIVSCGLGEDGSFDVEFAARFGARVIVVDPTPRAIAHFNDIAARFGQAASGAYVDGGRQPASAYDLAALDAESLVLEPFALWTEETTLKFFAPSDPSHVSHSVVNFQNGYASDTPFIEVQAITPEALVARHGLAEIALMKLDIEGAEIAVIPHMLEQGIRPRQLLIEFDEMTAPSARSKRNVEAVDAALRRAGYACIDFDGGSNFLYTRA